jgi:hypothetical protein
MELCLLLGLPSDLVMSQKEMIVYDEPFMMVSWCKSARHP